MRILIIRFSSFGDVVLTTPVIKAIKDKYPKSEIDFIVYDTFSQAITLNPNIRNVIQFEKKKSKDKEYIKSIIRDLKNKDYDYVIDLHSKFLSRIIGKSICSRYSSKSSTKYFRYKKRKWWKTLLVKLRLIPYKADCTIVESYFTALKGIGIFFNDKNIKNGLGDGLEFYIDEKVEREIVQKYDLMNKKYVVLAPGASKFTKKWPYYNELCQKILEIKDVFVFVIGGKEDYGVIEEASKFEATSSNTNNNKVINLCGKISFKESGAILKYANLAIVNDSGPFHIARAVKTKTFVFFGPTDPKLFSFEKDTKLFYNDKCKPHSLYGDDKFPKKYEDCMSGICVDCVYEEVKKVLGE